MTDAVAIPQIYQNDRYWKPVIFLFSKQDKLQQYFTTNYFDLEHGLIKTQALKRLSTPWSKSERFMLQLALHLYNERNKINLGDMDYLDEVNGKLAIEAIKIRYTITDR